MLSYWCQQLFESLFFQIHVVFLISDSFINISSISNFINLIFLFLFFIEQKYIHLSDIYFAVLTYIK